MKPLALLIVFAAALTARGDDSALVKAAKKVSPGTVITNDSVQKDAKASSSTAGAGAPASVAPKSPLAAQAAEQQQRAVTEARLHVAEEAVATAEKELAAVEQAYYDERDPDVRDRDITRRFALTQLKLEAARSELVAARVLMAALPPTNVTILP